MKKASIQLVSLQESTGTVGRDHTTRHRYERFFFSGMALLIFGSVFLGFAHSYYLAGIFKAPLPNLLIQIHGAVFSLWILFLLTQTSLVAIGRTDVHRRLGLLGFGLACLMVVLGVMAATDHLIRGSASGQAGVAARAFYTVTLSTMLSFSILIYLAFLQRYNSSAHKRLILIATIAICDAAFQRWPISHAHWGEQTAALVCTVPLLLLIAAYDYWSLGRVHRATIWASILVVGLQQIRDPIGRSPLWQMFAAWVQSHLSRHPG